MAHQLTNLHIGFLLTDSVFAVGMIPVQEDLGNWATFKKLMRELKTVQHESQKRRIILQGVIFVVLFVLVIIFTRKQWVGGSSEDAYEMDAMAFIGMLFSATAIGLWYEVYSPALSDNTFPIWGLFFWVVVQFWLASFVINLIVNGNIARTIYSEVVSYLTGISCVIEFIVSEAYVQCTA